MSEEELVQFIMNEVGRRVAEVNRTSDWDTAQASILREVLEGVTAGVHRGLEEHKTKINQLVMLTTWLLYTHPSRILTTIPPGLLEFLQHPIEPIDPLT